MNEYAGILLNCLNSMCFDLGQKASGIWSSQRGVNWEIEVDTFTRSPYAEKLKYKPAGIEDNLWLIQGIIHTWESDFSDLFDRDNSKKLLMAFRSLKKVRTNLAHSNTYPTKGQCIFALNQMKLISEAFTLHRDLYESVDAVAKELVESEEEDPDTEDMNDVIDPIMIKDDEIQELRSIISERDEELQDLKKDNFDLRRENNNQRPQKTNTHYKKLLSERDETIRKLESKLKASKADQRILKIVRPKSDHPVEELTELAALRGDVARMSNELKTFEEDNLQARGHTRYYRKRMKEAEAREKLLNDESEILKANNESLHSKLLEAKKESNINAKRLRRVLTQNEKLEKEISRLSNQKE